jgi:hypothetical protein
MSVAVGLIVIGVCGARHGTDQPTVEIEGSQVPYYRVHVMKDGHGTWAVEYHNADDDIDYTARVPISKGQEIIAWQVSRKSGRNYEESRGIRMGQPQAFVTAGGQTAHTVAGHADMGDERTQ